MKGFGDGSHEIALLCQSNKRAKKAVSTRTQIKFFRCFIHAALRCASVCETHKPVI